MLLTESNPKLTKSLAYGYRTYGLSLAPNDVSGYQTCPKASPACREECLFYAGRGRFQKTQEARIKKTHWFFEDRKSFMAQLEKEVDKTSRKARDEGLNVAYRLNLDSDIPWEKFSIINNFPHLQWYDYTKVLGRKTPPNYHLTFSRSEVNDSDVRKALKLGMNIAVVFDHLPETYMGRPVIDGDTNDLRFLDPRGVIIGLKAKGRAKGSDSGFVVRLNQLRSVA